MNDWPEPNANELTIYEMAWELSDKEDEIAQLKAQLNLRPTVAVSKSHDEQLLTSAKVINHKEQELTPSAPAINASDSPELPTNATAWSLERPKRFQGYRKPLYDLLKAEHAAGKPKPSARYVLDKWKEKPPIEVPEVTNNGLKYYDTNGNTKSAELEAISKTIGRMTKKTPD